MTSNHHASYALGYTRATMDGTKRCDLVTGSETQKAVLNSDCGLQPAHTKTELLVILDQHARVNAFSGLVHTACHAMGDGGTQSRCANLARGGSRLR